MEGNKVAASVLKQKVTATASTSILIQRIRPKKAATDIMKIISTSYSYFRERALFPN